MRISDPTDPENANDLNYFDPPHRLRRWRTVLSFGVPAVALLWMASLDAVRDRRPYFSGPVASAHAFLERRCEACHVPAGGYRAHATDSACLACHQAPAHSNLRQHDVSCASCHREHQGRVRLAAMPDPLCVRCHASLNSGERHPRIEGAVRRFPDAHPEFAASRPGYRDPGTVRFNHQLHLRGDLPGPSGSETLSCEACHATARRTARGRIQIAILPIAYQRHCARCHPLYFDERLEQQSPHGDAAAVAPFVRSALADYIAAHPDAVAAPDPPARRLPADSRQASGGRARTADEWVALEAARAESYLWNRACATCHLIASPRIDGVPVVATTGIQEDWMPNARFDHSPHLAAACGSCHAAARSRDSADALMPRLASCAACHAPRTGSESRCSGCHAYHDWSQASPLKPVLNLRSVQ